MIHRLAFALLVASCGGSIETASQSGGTEPSSPSSPEPSGATRAPASTDDPAPSRPPRVLQPVTAKVVYDEQYGPFLDIYAADAITGTRLVMQLDTFPGSSKELDGPRIYGAQALWLRSVARVRGASEEEEYPSVASGTVIVRLGWGGEPPCTVDVHASFAFDGAPTPVTIDADRVRIEGCH